MVDFIRKLFDTAEFPARWNCGQAWADEPGWGWLHIVSDVLIWGAYFTIPMVLAYFVTKRRDIPFPRIFWLFGAFIFACGFGHLIEATIFWWPAYRFSGVVKAATAAVSWATVLALVPITPQALKLPGVMKLNEQLQSEIEEHTAIAAELANQQARLRAVVEYAVDPIITIDARGVIETFNPAAERAFGYLATDVRGKPVTLLMSESDSSQHDLYMNRYLTTGVKRIIGIGRQITARRRNGSTFPADLSISEMNVNGERMFTGILRDVTDRVQREQQLNNANQQLHSRQREIKEFLSIITHDLRHPMVSIQGLLTLTKRSAFEQLPAEQQENIDLALAECDRMKRLLDQISSLSRIERIEIRQEQVNIGKVVSSCVERFRPQLASQEVDVRVNVPDVEVVTARTHIEEAIINLIDNALKYGRAIEGRSTLRVEATLEGSICRVCVVDNGPGIDSIHHDRVFQPFRRLANPSIDGSGIGLTAVRRLIERIGGEVKLDSALNQGTTFTIVFPVMLC